MPLIHVASSVSFPLFFGFSGFLGTSGSYGNGKSYGKAWSQWKEPESKESKEQTKGLRAPWTLVPPCSAVGSSTGSSRFQDQPSPVAG